MKGMPEEYTLELTVEGVAAGSFQITPEDLEDWLTGFLYANRMIEVLEDIRDVEFVRRGYVLEAHVALRDPLRARHAWMRAGQELAQFIGVGDGCESLRSALRASEIYPVHGAWRGTIAEIKDYMTTMVRSMEKYKATGGVHGAAIVTQMGELILREDVGRHNAVDKVIGYALRHRISGEEILLLGTGRLTLQMILKAARYGIGVAASRSAATHQAVLLAGELGMDVLGYVRGGNTILYTSGGWLLDGKVGEELASSL